MPAFIAERRRSWDTTPRPRASSWLVGAFVLFLLGLAAGKAIDHPAVAPIMAENGPIETIQAVLLGAIALLYVVVACRSRDAKSAFCVLVALGSVLAVQRELPRCGSVFFEGGACLTGGAKDAISVAAVLAAVALALLLRVDWRTVVRIGNLRWVWPAALSVLLLASAELFEAWHHQEFEELLELAGYIHIGAFGLWLLGTTHRAHAPREDGASPEA